jgi:BASS family bile acid:Na+ symporter
MILLEQLPSLTLFVMMLAMGMGLTLDDFARGARRPRAALLGLVAQLVILPLAAAGIALGLALPQPVAAGLLLIAVCPGGTTSNAFSYLARGDVALSVSLTAMTSLTAFLWIPTVLAWGLPLLRVGSEAIELPFQETVVRVLLTTGLPLAAGMALRSGRPGLVARWRRSLLIGSIGVLLLLIAGLPVRLAAEQVELTELFATAGPAVFLLLLVSAGGALALARLCRVGRRQSITLAIEVGIQNFNLAMVLALAVLAEPRFLGAAIVYLPAMLLFAGGLVWLGRRDDAQAATPPRATAARAASRP